MHEDLHLDVVFPVADVLLATGAPEWEYLRDYLRVSLAMIAQRTLDEDVRVRWFRGPVGREMTRLVGPIETVIREDAGTPEIAGADEPLLRLLLQGMTNAEIAQELEIDEEVVARRLAELFAEIGASSRAEATAFAFQVV